MHTVCLNLSEKGQKKKKTFLNSIFPVLPTLNYLKNFIFQVTDFIERLMKHATNSEVLLFKRLIEQKLTTVLTSSNSALSSDLFNGSGLSEEEVVDFEFISNPQAIQTSVKNTFGYVRSRNSSGTNSVGSAHGSLRQQPPISRPTSSNRYVIQWLKTFV